jgi:hypothetical protein
MLALGLDAKSAASTNRRPASKAFSSGIDRQDYACAAQ